jgi:anti-sigma B factor antagonist
MKGNKTMKTSIDHSPDGVAVVRLDGRLDFLSASDARKHFSDAVDKGSRRVVVDLAKVTFIDSSGLGSLVGGLKTARQAGGDLRISSPSTQAKSLLKLTSLDQVFRAHPTVEDALTAFRR